MTQFSSRGMVQRHVGEPPSSEGLGRKEFCHLVEETGVFALIARQLRK